ncbi:MAG: hypothetical protein J0M33_12835 [Anaerolineae bacterium]|nr:hypothetical protein [Anaerolineae bacterium]
MRQLVIDYVLEGHQRGYNFTSSTQGFHDDVLKSIWRTAMPKGQGWGAYVGARSLKAFALEDSRLALSEVTVTDRRDESGRGGIRQAIVSIMQPGEYQEVLIARLQAYPVSIQTQIDHRPSLGDRARLADRAFNRKQKNGQVICTADWSPDSWLCVEALTVKLALSPGVFLRARGAFIPFTSLALDYHGESWLVVLPTDRLTDKTVKPVHLG